MQRRLDLLGNVVICVQVSSKVLVRELLRSANLRLVSDPVSHVVDHLTCGEHIVSQQRVSSSYAVPADPSFEPVLFQTLGPFAASDNKSQRTLFESTSDQGLGFFALGLAVCDQRLNFSRHVGFRRRCPLVDALIGQPTELRSAERYPAALVEPYAG